MKNPLFNSPTNSSQRGFTLVELMISMTIGLFISAGMVALLIGNKQSYRDSESMARVQENGRFAIEFLAREIRQAGLQNFSGTTATWPPVNYIGGWQGVSSAPLEASLPSADKYTPNTDIFRITYYDSDVSADVTRIYYIRTGAGEQPGLYQKKSSSSIADELIECVYDMQLHYGIDNTGDEQIDTYVSADSISDWNRVFAVKIDLLVGSSEDNLVDTAMSLPFEKNDGTFFTATNRRIYQMFSTTIALRNRMK
ncbi:hypothetical protein CKO09_06730 [Chromatium weissei]|nr:hypothetical protein [Chromatium weissei]